MPEDTCVECRTRSPLEDSPYCSRCLALHYADIEGSTDLDDTYFADWDEPSRREE